MIRKSLGILLLTLPAMTLASANVSRWDFDVYLNDKKVGSHHYEILEAGKEREVRSEASFDYRILFIPAYRYEHSNAERWVENCLVEFDARTNANGERITVSGTRVNNAFRVERGDAPVELPECVMSFAYWNPDFLAQSQLLNPQTGEYVAVNVEDVGEEVLLVRGERVVAQRYRLTAYETDLTLWYSPQREWLGLESIARGGHVIRYELS